jgi:hypothetical protein
MARAAEAMAGNRKPFTWDQLILVRQADCAIK